jgi:lysozyme
MITLPIPVPTSRRRAALALAALAVLSLAGCGGPPRPSRWDGVTAPSAKGDAKPHPGVARAHAYPIQGIDVSKFQGDIDWQAAARAGVRFAFIKATEGGDHLDERFHAHWQGAGAAGVLRGAYHFMFWCRPAHEQAAWFKSHVPRDAHALPPVLDLEWNAHSKTCPKRLAPEVARKKIDLMLREMEAHTGKRPIIYTDIVFHRDVLVGHYPQHKFWLRSVAAEPHEKYESRSWTFWQFTSTGRVPGIRGPVDRNVFVGSFDQLQALARAPR